MSEHEPECWCRDCTHPHVCGRCRNCICDELRAREQRLCKEPLLVASRRAGWNDALIAAREAVAKAWHCSDPMNCTVDEPVCGNRREILAAIDALKEKR